MPSSSIQVEVFSNPSTNGPIAQPNYDDAMLVDRAVVPQRSSAPTEADYLAQLKIEEEKAAKGKNPQMDGNRSPVLRNHQDGAMILEESPTKSHILLPSQMNKLMMNDKRNAADRWRSAVSSVIEKRKSESGIAKWKEIKESPAFKHQLAERLNSKKVNPSGGRISTNNSRELDQKPDNLSKRKPARGGINVLVTAPGTGLVLQMRAPQARKPKEIKTMRAESQSRQAMRDAAAALKEANDGMHFTMRRMDVLLKSPKAIPSSRCSTDLNTDDTDDTDDPDDTDEDKDENEDEEKEEGNKRNGYAPAEDFVSEETLE